VFGCAARHRLDALGQQLANAGLLTELIKEIDAIIAGEIEIPTATSRAVSSTTIAARHIDLQQDVSCALAF
jgi:hypothetical protein